MEIMEIINYYYYYNPNIILPSLHNIHLIETAVCLLLLKKLNRWPLKFSICLLYKYSLSLIQYIHSFSASQIQIMETFMLTRSQYYSSGRAFMFFVCVN